MKCGTRPPMMAESPEFAVILPIAMANARACILAIARDRLGEPSEQQMNTLNTINDIHRLSRITLAIRTAKSWNSLLRIK